MTFTPETELTEERHRATEIQIGEDDVLYIYVENTHGMPPNKWAAYIERIQKAWQEKLPDIVVIVGAHDFKFTVISKKLVFAHKLAGNI